MKLYSKHRLLVNPASKASVNNILQAGTQNAGRRLCFHTKDVMKLHGFAQVTLLMLKQNSLTVMKPLRDDTS